MFGRYHCCRRVPSIGSQSNRDRWKEPHCFLDIGPEWNAVQAHGRIRGTRKTKICDMLVVHAQRWCYLRRLKREHCYMGTWYKYHNALPEVSNIYYFLIRMIISVIWSWLQASTWGIGVYAVHIEGWKYSIRRRQRWSHRFVWFRSQSGWSRYWNRASFR